MIFVFCTLLGLFTCVLGVALVVGGVLGVGYVLGKITDRVPTISQVGRGIGKVILVCLLCILAGFFLVAMHDVGCSIQGHPEHHILKDDNTQQMNMPKESK